MLRYLVMKIAKIAYFLFIQKLPSSYYPGGNIFNAMRVKAIGKFIQLGVGCRIQSNVYIGNNVTIGDNCQINENVKLRYVTIGNQVLIAPGVTIIGVDHIIDNSDISIMNQGQVIENIIIGDNTWIATNAIILKGVHIGTGCVIAAGAVVTKDCQDYGIYGGVPAKLIRSRLTNIEN